MDQHEKVDHYGNRNIPILDSNSQWTGQWLFEPDVWKEVLKQMAPRENQISKSYLYIFKRASMYKIGYSKDPDTRLKVIESHSGESIQELLRVETLKAKELEKLLHKHFSQKRLKGEWFHLNQSDLCEAKKLLKENL